MTTARPPETGRPRTRRRPEGRAAWQRAAAGAAMAVILLAVSPGCRRFLTSWKLDDFAAVRSAAVEWEIRDREGPPDIYRETIRRILASAGVQVVDAGAGAPDMIIRIELRGSWTYHRPKAGDWWDSGEVTMIGPAGRPYFRHFYGDEADAPASFYAAPKGFYEQFLLMASRIWGRQVAESEVQAMAGDPRFAGVPGRVLRRLDGEAGRDGS